MQPVLVSRINCINVGQDISIIDDAEIIVDFTYVVPFQSKARKSGKKLRPTSEHFHTL